MSNILEHYKVLGVSVGAGIADVTSSYKRLCRSYHPDVNSDPGSEELMKKINIAYTALREKLLREAALRERTAYARPVRRYAAPETRSSWAETRKTGAEAEKEAFLAIHSYFKAISAFDFSGAYNYLSAYDRRHITRESFIKWRASVARLYPMREFEVAGGSTVAAITFNDDKTLQARKFRVMVTEEDFAENRIRSDEVEKLVIRENGMWKVFLGYRNVGELTHTFDERFETGRKRDIEKRLDEFYNGLDPEYNMLNMAGMHKAVSRELYRQKRFGGTLTLAAISVKAGGIRETGREELLRSVARTINNSLRETDIPAYEGGGVFVILFVGLKKKNAEDIVGRLIKNIRKGAGTHLGERADIEYIMETWTGGSLAGTDALNKILQKFHEKV